VVRIQLSLSLSTVGVIICMVEMKRKLKKMNLVLLPSLRFVNGLDLDGMHIVTVAFPVQKPIMIVIMVSLN
jgi:hypothetical protein